MKSANINDLEAWQHNALTTTKRWSDAFERLVELRGDTLSEKEKSGVTILRIQQELALTSLKLKRTVVDDQTMWDEFLPSFTYIVELASSLTLASTASFSLDLGIIGPLYEVASRCRDPIIRREAIRLLKRTQRQEGVWNASLTAMVAERVVAIEEEGLGDVRCCADVPDCELISCFWMFI